eukprot:TRINITY_DN22772_c0_g2_i1.p1 TRINITY_DN22772_c0_g2~~TRINITY_DN22772_c0_g2_i1.p1  ORF type:complete len:325 (+),score=60.66 TRINITY_DN22772_c0_g2_i1:167-1141(+)
MCILCVAAAQSVGAASTVTSKSPPFIVAKFVSPVLFSFLGINVYSYGALVATALGMALWVFSLEIRRARIDLDELICFFVFLFGFAVGSKSHVAISAVAHGEPLTWQALDIRTGHSFMGSIIGAVGCMLAYIKTKGVGVMEFLDVLLPCCLLGHFFGKIGCFLSGDGCYGPPADPEHVPWAMSFPNAMIPTHVPVHPTPIYEGWCSLCVFLITRWLLPLPDEDSNLESAKFPRVGRRTALVLVLYGIERVILEKYRRHPAEDSFFGLSEYQAIAVVLLCIGIFIELVVSKEAIAHSAKLSPTEPEEKADGGGAMNTKKAKKKRA